MSLRAATRLALALVALAGCSDGGGDGPDGGGPQPEIAVAPGSLAFSAAAGDPLPRALESRVTNAGDGTLERLESAIAYAPAGPAGWLTATLDADAAPAALSVRPLTSDLAPGTYAATVTVSSAAPGVASATVGVQYTVTPGPLLALDPASLAFSAAAGTGPTPTQLLQVLNGAGGNLDGLTLEVAYGAGQPTGWLTAFLGATSAPTGILVRADATSLAAGTYSASLVLRSPRAGNSPQSAAVTFQVIPAALR